MKVKLFLHLTVNREVVIGNGGKHMHNIEEMHGGAWSPSCSFRFTLVQGPQTQ